MIHSRYCKPRIFPWNSSRAPEQIDRLQEFSGDDTLNREKQFEIGRVGVLGFKEGTPSFSYSCREFEYGSMKFIRSLANIAEPATGEDHDVTLEDLKATKFDIAMFLTDDATSAFKGTAWFPKLRVNSLSLNIADPEAIVERNFDFVGEDYIILDGKYFAYETATASSNGELDITLDPVPVEYADGKYIFRVLRVRSGVVSELIEDETSAYADNTWRYSANHVYVQDCAIGDIVKVYYESSTAYTTTWTDNDTDEDFLMADCCEIYMKVGVSNRIYRLQSCSVEASFDRSDYKEIGNPDVVQTGAKSQTVTVNLNKYQEGFDLEDILAGDTSYPYINPRNFATNIQFMVKIFTDSTHTTFKMGYLTNNLSPTTMNVSQSVEEYQQATIALESDNLLMSDDETDIVFS